MRRPAAAGIVKVSKRNKTARDEQEIWEEEPDGKEVHFHFPFDVPDPEEFPHCTPMYTDVTPEKWPPNMPKFYTVTSVGPRGGPPIGIHFATWTYIHDRLPPNTKDDKSPRLHGSGVRVEGSFTLRDALLKWVRHVKHGVQPKYMNNAPPEELVSTE